ncbi:MAG TPA: hypothetical protein VES39_01385 [Rhodospirillales bacterium]|nr:hypothetical protein [Rhodospirillales bacterium]
MLRYRQTLMRNRSMKRAAFSATITAIALLGSVSVASAETINCPRNIINRTVDNVFVNGTCTIRQSTVQGNIVVASNGNLLVQGSTILGSVQSEGGVRVRLQPNPTTGRETFVNGDVRLRDMVPGTNASTVIDVAVGGTVLIDSNDAPTNLFGNDVNGDVQVFQNTRVVRIRDNTIDGNLQCTSNTPAPVNGGGNIVQGNDENQCAGFSQ